MTGFSMLLRLAALAALAVPLLSAPAEAQSAAAFSRFGLGARAAVVPLTADLTGAASPYHNPALAPFQEAQALEISGGLLPFDREWQAVQIGTPLRPRAGVAGGVVSGGVNEIDGRDRSGVPTETYETAEYAFFFAFGIRFSERVSGGAGLRLYRSDLFPGVESPTALGATLGLTARLSERLAAGVVVEDLFARYEWNAAAAGGSVATDAFPTRVRAGAAYGLGTAPEGWSRGVVAADLELAVEDTDASRPGGGDVIGTTPVFRDETTDVALARPSARVGGEVWLAEPFAVRAGVDRIGEGALAEARPSAGFAVRRRLNELGLRVDYTATLEPYGTGVLQMATLRLEL